MKKKAKTLPATERLFLVTKNITVQREIMAESASAALDIAIDGKESEWEHTDTFYSTECEDSTCRSKGCDGCPPSSR